MTIKTFDLKNCRIARENPRTERSPESISKMAASVLAIGLLHSLVAYEENGTAHITAGGTRLEAIRLLLNDGKISADNPLITDIPITVKDKSIAIDTALTSNVMQSVMSAADQYKAFSALHHAEGVEVEEIAARYFTDAPQVRRILKLANLAKPIFAAFADGKITLEDAKAYAGSDDQDRQLKAWKECGTKSSPHTIRRAMRDMTYKSTDALAQFVGLAAYQEAGGQIEDDLFTEDVILLNADILAGLVPNAIEAFTATFTKQGWGKVEFFESRDALWEEASQLSRKLKSDFKPNKRDKTSYDKAKADYNSVKGYYWSLTEKERGIRDRAEAKMEKIEARSQVFKKKDIEKGYVLCCLGHDGPEVQYYAQTRKRTPSAKAKEAAKAEAKAAKADVAFPNSFIENVTRTAGNALMSHMVKNPNRVARVMAILAFSNNIRGLDVQARSIRKMKYAHDIESAENPTLDAILNPETPETDTEGMDYNERMALNETLEQAKIKTRFDALMALSDVELDAALASVMLPKFELGYFIGNATKPTFDCIAEASAFNLHDNWAFDGEELAALNKVQLCKIVTELGKDATQFDKTKKSELVLIVERYVNEAKWTPEFVRTHDPVIATHGEKTDVEDDVNAEVEALENKSKAESDTTASPKVA